MNHISECKDPIRSSLLTHLRADNIDIAITVENKSLRYHEVLAETIKLHRVITERCIKPKRMGIFAYRSAISYIATLTSMLSGVTFVYLNPSFPIERLQSIVESAELDVIVVDKCSKPHYDKLMDSLSVHYICVHEADLASVPVIESDVMAYYWLVADYHRTIPTDVAYIKFTSGSTGVPKGVPISYSNLFAFINYNQQRYEFTTEDIFSQTFDQSFDLSLFDIFLAFNSGGRLCVPSKLSLLAPTKFVNDNQITVWFSVPSLANQMAARNFLSDNSLPTLRLSLFCGEALPRATIQRWQRAAPQSLLENLYGPTEATIACFTYRWRGESSVGQCLNDIVPIGHPYPHVDAILMDETGRIIEDADVQGKLLVRGSQIFSGYLNRSTDQQPFVSVNGEQPFYDTGDIVSRNQSNLFVFHGRSDHQVKVNGFRVELGEIESIARVHGVMELVAITFPPGPVAEEIVLFHKSQSDIPNLTALFREKLPAYMCPKRIIELAYLPLNSNGKLDRNALIKQLVTNKGANS